MDVTPGESNRSDPGRTLRGGAGLDVAEVARGEVVLHGGEVGVALGVAGVSASASPGHHEDRLRLPCRRQITQGSGSGDAVLDVGVVLWEAWDLALLLEEHPVPLRCIVGQGTHPVRVSALGTLDMVDERQPTSGQLGLLHRLAAGFLDHRRDGCVEGLVHGVAVAEEEQSEWGHGGAAWLSMSPQSALI